MNRQSKINLLVIAGGLCLLCLAAIPSETVRTKALQRRYSLKPTEEYLVAAETSARQDWRNMIILRTALGVVFALNVFAIWKVAGTEDDHGGQPPVSVFRVVAKLLVGTLKYASSYLLGILVAALQTGLIHDDDFKQFDSWPAIVFETILGIYFFFGLLIFQFVDLVLHAWWALFILLIPFVCEAFVFRRQSSLRLWRPLWIGFPAGFLGTMGAYWWALSSL